MCPWFYHARASFWDNDQAIPLWEDNGIQATAITLSFPIIPAIAQMLLWYIAAYVVPIIPHTLIEASKIPWTAPGNGFLKPRPKVSSMSLRNMSDCLYGNCVGQLTGNVVALLWHIVYWFAQQDASERLQ